MDSSGVDHFYVYAYEKLVNDMLDLQSRPYSLARDAVSKYKFYLKKKIKALWKKIFKKQSKNLN